MPGDEDAKRDGLPRLFLISSDARDPLAEILAGAGWHIVASRNPVDPVRRFLTSGAAIAVVDARGDVVAACETIARLGPAIAANRAALLAIIGEGDTAYLEAVRTRGATHYMRGGDPVELIEAVAFAADGVDRQGDWGSWLGNDRASTWRVERDARMIALSTPLARRLHRPERIGWRAALKLLPAGDRALAVAALRRLRYQRTTAFTHRLPNDVEVIENLHRDTNGAIRALVEWPREGDGEVEDATRGTAEFERWFAAKIAGGASMDVMLIALTRLDLVNASHGRSAGDALLRDAFRRIGDIVRNAWGEDAWVGRGDGTAFLIATPASEKAGELGGEIVAALSRPFVIADAMVVAGARIGVACGGGATAKAALTRAAGALAEARAGEGDPVRLATSDSPGGPSLDRLAIELRRALVSGEIDIAFQPQVSVSTGKIVGVEALARWRHATLGQIGADALFAAAERADLTTALSDAVQARALAEATRWPASLASLRLSINVTASDVARAAFVDVVLDRIDASGFPRKRVTIEITESGLIADLGRAADLLARLRSAGCRIAIDDFGTGYSSLAYLKALPLDYLKIDKALAQDISGTARDRIVVRGVIEMARSLGLAVIAEGVETAEQLDLLAQEGCNYFQGFLCAGALASADLIAFVDPPA